MIGVGAIALVGVHRNGVMAVKSELREDLIRVASAAASQVDGDAHARLTDPNLQDSELYLEALEPLRKIRTSTPGVQFVYTLIRDPNGRVRFVLDAANPGDHDNDGREDRSQLWEHYERAEPIIRAALGDAAAPGKAVASPEPYSDDWGSFVSGYAPFFDSSGKQVGVVGVDISAGVYLARLEQARQTALLGAMPALCAAAVIGVCIYIVRRRSLASTRALIQSRAALASSEARARSLIEGSDIVLWEYAPERGVFTYISPQAERFGYPLSDWFTPGFWDSHLHPEDRAAATGYCREQTLLGNNHRLQYRMFNANGSIVWIDDVVSISKVDGETVLHGVFVDITERKQAEDRLRELYQRLQKIASQLPGVAYQYRLRLDGTSCFPYASDGIRSIFLVEPGAVRDDASPVFDLIHPEDVDAVKESLLASAANLTPWRIEHRVRFPDGQIRWLLGNAVPQREADGSTLWHGFTTDITDRKHDEECLNQANKRFELARRSVRVGLWDWNISAGVFDWDEGMYELYDIDRGRPSAPIAEWAERVHPEDIDRLQQEVQNALIADSDFDATFRVRRRDNSILWLASHGIIVRDAAGVAVRMVGLNIDITRQVCAQEALTRARDQAEAANRAKSLFLANMSHEIRTPLTAILGYTDLLRDAAANMPPERVELVETIRTAGRHLLDIINDVLDLSKIEAGKMTVERLPTNLPAIVSDVETLLRPRARAKGITLGIMLETPVPDFVMSDPTRLRQILMNLAGNAIKFTEAGSVTISITAKKRLRFDITDSGVGMTAEQSTQLFKPFAQADASVTRRHGGTGLGLAICRRLAHLMGGEVTLLQSQPGVGSTFRLDLPLDRTPEAVDLESFSASATAAPRRPAPPPPQLPIRVLLAEDGIDNQRLITFYLKRTGAQVTVVENGVEALAKIAEVEKLGLPFQLIITDVQMPIMDGCTLAKTLRDQGCTLPIIALTAHAMSEDRDKCIASGCNGYATKPIDQNALISLCAEMLNPAAVAA